MFETYITLHMPARDQGDTEVIFDLNEDHITLLQLRKMSGLCAFDGQSSSKMFFKHQEEEIRLAVHLFQS